MTDPIDAINAVQGPLAAPGAVSAPTLGNEALAERFSALMDPANSPPRPSLAQAQDEGPSAIGQFLSTQETMLRRTAMEADHLSANSHTYSAHELVAESMRISREAAMGSIVMSTMSASTQGANKDLQTLLKNQ
jgi:type III secretion system HrpB2-like protein